MNSMDKKRKIVSITGSRSDYGLMTPVYKRIDQNNRLTLNLVVTGTHFLPDFKNSLEKISRDRYGKIYRLSLSANKKGENMASDFGNLTTKLSKLFTIINPDLLLLQGDRGEMLCGAIVAAYFNIPIVHMSGGDYSGSIDDSIRNAISKFAHIHLTTCAQSTQRLLVMGEKQNRIFQVGDPGIDLIMSQEYLSKKTLCKQYNLDPFKPIILATQHPVTTEADQAREQLWQILQALEKLNYQTVITYPNGDVGSREMVKLIESYRRKPFLRIVPNLGSKGYLSFMKIAAVVVGNSSSGIFESPSFQVPVVNIGTRQHGRLQANNVINVGYDKTAIGKAVLFALHNKKFRMQLKLCQNPYGDGHAAEKTVKVLSKLKINKSLLEKWMI